MANAAAVTDQNFDVEVLGADKPVLVDFWAAWCAPCRAIAPMVEELATELDGQLKVMKVDVDNNPGVAARYGIRSIPTLLLFKGGEVVEQMIGAGSKQRLQQMVKAHLA